MVIIQLLPKSFMVKLPIHVDTGDYAIYNATVMFDDKMFDYRIGPDRHSLLADHNTLQGLNS